MWLPFRDLIPCAAIQSAPAPRAIYLAQLENLPCSLGIFSLVNLE